MHALLQDRVCHLQQALARVQLFILLPEVVIHLSVWSAELIDVGLSLRCPRKLHMSICAIGADLCIQLVMIRTCDSVRA